MNNIPSLTPPNVPSIRIHNVDDTSALFEGSDLFSTDIYSFYNQLLVSEDAGIYSCSPGLRSEYPPLNATFNPSAELEDIPELSHLSTTCPTSQPYLSGHGYSLPYPSVLRDPAITASVDGGLSPSSLGSSNPSPTSSFGSSLSPSSFYDTLTFSDAESPISLSPATPDQPFYCPSRGLSHRQSNDSLVLHSSFPESVPSEVGSPTAFLGSQTGSHRLRSKSASSLTRSGPVASQAMLEANGRRRRHPAQFTCPECGQTFTALFSLKRHTQSHTGERPFECKIPGCKQRFFNSSDCKRHEKSKKRHKDLPMQ